MKRIFTIGVLAFFAGFGCTSKDANPSQSLPVQDETTADLMDHGTTVVSYTVTNRETNYTGSDTEGLGKDVKTLMGVDRIEKTDSGAHLLFAGSDLSLVLNEKDGELSVIEGMEGSTITDVTLENSSGADVGENQGQEQAVESGILTFQLQQCVAKEEEQKQEEQEQEEPKEQDQTEEQNQDEQGQEQEGLGQDGQGEGQITGKVDEKGDKGEECATAWVKINFEAVQEEKEQEQKEEEQKEDKAKEEKKIEEEQKEPKEQDQTEEQNQDEQGQEQEGLGQDGQGEGQAV